MGRATRWSRALFAALLLATALPVLGLVPARSVGAVGCGEMPELAAPAAQAQERWRYVYDGAGSYELVGWNPTEATLLVNSPGCAISTIGLVNIDLLSGAERWRVTSDQWEGMGYGAKADSGLILLPTTNALYAYDDSTGQQIWSYGHGYDSSFPEIVAIANNIAVLSADNSLTGVNIGAGTMVWQQTVPVSFVSDWEHIEGGSLVGIGQPKTGGQDVLAFGIDPATGALLWQTPVGQTVSSTGGTMELTGNGTGLVAAEVLTDATASLVAVDGATGAIRWTAPLPGDGTYGRTYLTNGAQPAVIYATGGALDVKSATAYDAATGAVRWQSDVIGADAILADDTRLVGAGPTLSYMNALVLVDGESGEMIWSQPYALVDGSFSGAAQISIDEVVFTPALQEEPAPTVMAVDLATGNVNWASAYPEFAYLSLDGVAAGIALATGETDTEAVLVGLAS